MNRRDLLLNEMGITQWQLTKPQVLKGDAQIAIPTSVKLIVICEEDQQNSPLFQDILFSLNCHKQQYQWLTQEQALRIQLVHQPVIWLIEANIQAVKLNQKFANLPQWQTPSWQALQQPAQKRQLWQQCQTFFTHFEE